MIDKTHFAGVASSLQKDLSSLRTGRAIPALLEDIQVEAYGSNMPLQQLASITAPEPRLLVVQPWDAQTIKDVEKAIRQSDLGLNPVVDGVIIRVPFPALTEEKRKELVKIMHGRLEEAKVKLRQMRETILKEWKIKKTAGEMSEDDFFRLEKDLQDLVDETNQHIESMGEDKEKEMLTI
ncbi:MAG: ribosome recycling factor [Patescibacteria group bacterium]